MAYIYSDVEELEREPKVGSHQCVALLQYYAKLPNTAFWKEGRSVMEIGAIPKGAAIATFVNGKYQNLSTGNHAAFFISKDAGGITIMDQWARGDKKYISSRYIPRRGKLQSGAFVDPSNNADAYSIID